MQDQAFRLRLQVAAESRTLKCNPTAGKVKLDSADKSDTVSFAKNAVSKELGEDRAGAGARSPKNPYPKIPSHTRGGIFGIILSFR